MKRTKEVSEIAGVSVRTLQYYDDVGLLEAERTENNHRIYDEKILEKIWKIIIYKEIGFDLKEIKRIFLTSEEGEKEMLKEKLESMEKRMDGLKKNMEFASYVFDYGMPEIPSGCKRITYKEAVSELRKNLITKEEED